MLSTELWYNSQHHLQLCEHFSETTKFNTPNNQGWLLLREGLIWPVVIHAWWVALILKGGLTFLTLMGSGQPDRGQQKKSHGPVGSQYKPSRNSLLHCLSRPQLITLPGLRWEQGEETEMVHISSPSSWATKALSHTASSWSSQSIAAPRQAWITSLSSPARPWCGMHWESTLSPLLCRQPRHRVFLSGRHIQFQWFQIKSQKLTSTTGNKSEFGREYGSP